MVGEAGDGREAVELVESFGRMPFSSISMPKMTGLEAASVIKERHPDMGVDGQQPLTETSTGTRRAETVRMGTS